MLQHGQGGTRPAQRQGRALGWRGWTPDGPILLPPARPQRSRDRLRSHPLPHRLPCEGLEQPRLQREKTNAFFSLCQAGVYQGCRHCCAGSQHYILYLSAPCCGEGSWGEQPAPPPLLVPGRPGSHGWGRPGPPWTGPGCGALGERVRQNKTQWCLFAGGGSRRRQTPSLFPD